MWLKKKVDAKFDSILRCTTFKASAVLFILQQQTTINHGNDNDDDNNNNSQHSKFMCSLSAEDYSS